LTTYTIDGILKYKMKNDPKSRCPAMIDAGIEDVDSQAGIEFCNNCPYYPEHPSCILYETEVSLGTLRKQERAEAAKLLRDNGFSVDEISKQLGISVRCIERYLR